ncbi:unnamed protein product [Caenorhabditis nigoni]
MSEKKFVITLVLGNFKSIKVFEKINGNTEKHFGANWQTRLIKYDNGDSRVYLSCESFQTGNWSINTTCDVIINGTPYEYGTERPFEFHKNNMSFDQDIYKDDYQKYGIDKSVTIEFHVKINKMTGSFRSFDDDEAKESSDVVLVIGDQKFYVCKTYLSYHSTHFKYLFAGKIGKSIIELRGIDAKEFHTFLGIIYGFLLVEDANVPNLLKMAASFDAKIVIERCEKFLMASSKYNFVEKFQLSRKYKMENLKDKCLSEMNKKTDFVGLAPENSEDYSANTWKELYLKAVNFIQ